MEKDDVDDNDSSHLSFIFLLLKLLPLKTLSKQKVI